ALGAGRAAYELYGRDGAAAGVQRDGRRQSRSREPLLDARPLRRQRGPLHDAGASARRGRGITGRRRPPAVASRCARRGLPVGRPRQHSDLRARTAPPAVGTLTPRDLLGGVFAVALRRKWIPAIGRLGAW